LKLTTPAIFENDLSYVRRLDKRRIETIDLAVIHCTELPDLAAARSAGETIHYAKSRTGNSGHFYIERNGNTEQWVPLSRVAHHVKGYNERSIGIELVNQGRYPNWYDSRNQQMPQPYPAAQTDSLVGLLRHLQKELVNLVWIAGHEDLDTSRVPASDDSGASVRRKMDPGPGFPWQEVLEKIKLVKYLPRD